MNPGFLSQIGRDMQPLQLNHSKNQVSTIYTKSEYSDGQNFRAAQQKKQNDQILPSPILQQPPTQHLSQQTDQGKYNSGLQLQQQQQFEQFQSFSGSSGSQTGPQQLFGTGQIQQYPSSNQIFQPHTIEEQDDEDRRSVQNGGLPKSYQPKYYQEEED